MNSSAALKAFVGRNGGAVCTSSNARAVVDVGARAARPATKVLFFPDQHLGRNTAFQLGYPPSRCGCGTRGSNSAASTRPTVKDGTFLLWKGHCSVHQRFTPEHVAAFRASIRAAS